MPPTCRQAAGTVNLAVGHPSPALLPHAELAAATEAAAAQLRAGAEDPARFNLSYGRTAGEAAVTHALAAWLSRRGEGAAGGAEQPVAADRLFVTNGVSHAIDALCCALARPGDTVLVVRPTYFLASQIFIGASASQPLS
jgi:DNA-binding transcriptional MocR family regulator